MSSKRDKKATREEILDAAWELVAEKGAQVGMAEIAAIAGVSRQSVYLHFGNRGGLLMALLKRTDDRLGIREAFEAARATPTPAAKLDATLKVWFDFVAEILPVARDIIRLRATDKEAEAAWLDRMADLRRWMKLLVSDISGAGALRPHWQVDSATDYLWAAASVQAWALLVDDSGWSPADASRTLRQSIADSLLMPQPA
ncbi:TetR/AcrR family transcriptional regulator [Kordiimonas sp.]|uniref:TetR/AcrR family transcriptional regulator n=1 Tax=Kordiimonas sp. TaxID=1970157 RepID=UPI003A8D8325